jgi:hypothetical protein
MTFTDKELRGLGILLGCASFPVVLLISTLWGGWVLSVVWNWFMPQIFGLPTLTLIQAIAASLIIGWLAKARVPPDTKEKDALKALVEAYTRAFMEPAWVLAFAWIIQHFMGA